MKKSQNFVFTDKTGANEIFFGFVEIINVEFQELVKYCNEIVPHFDNEHFKVFNFSSSTSLTFDQSLGLYYHNENLF